MLLALTPLDAGALAARVREIAICTRLAAKGATSIAISPPSPLLSARRISVTYFSVTISTTVQNSIETIPITAVSAM